MNLTDTLFLGRIAQCVYLDVEEKEGRNSEGIFTTNRDSVRPRKAQVPFMSFFGYIDITTIRRNVADSHAEYICFLNFGLLNVSKT